MLKPTVMSTCLLFICLFMLVLPARPEEIASAQPQTEAQLPVEAVAITGIELGSFRLLPELTISGGYDDNIFATRTQTKSDRILHLLPSLDIRSEWSEHRLGFKAGADIARYDDYSSEDFEDYWLSTNGRYDFSDTFNLFGGLGYSREHEERGSPDDQNGKEPTVFYSRSAHLGSKVNFGDLGLRFGGSYEELDFDDVGTNFGLEINNDDRDRKRLEAGIRASYDWSEDLQPFVQYIYNDRKYDSRLDDFGYRRDSHGYGLAAGIKFILKPVLTSEIYAGILHQEYEDDRFSSLNEPDYGASVTWRPNPRTRIHSVVERSIEETTLFQSSGYLETRYALNLDYDLTRKTTFRGHAQFSRNDYQDISRKDNYLGAGFGLRYDLTRNLFLGADYTFSHRNSDISNSSNLDAADYYRHQFMVSLGANLYPVKEDPLKGFSKALEEMYAVNEPPQGFYLGGLVSYGATATNASEERSHGGSSQADFGGDAFSAGLFGGYSINHGRWVYGLEIEVEDSDLEWKHVKNKNESRTFSVKQNEGLGASARLGYTMLDGSVLYGRIGFIKTRFDTSYTINATALDSYSETETLTGLRLAMGLDVPLTEQWFWRMETTYTDYETYKVDSVAFSEKFDPEESFFSFGLGWHFDASEQHAEPIAIEDLSGPYAGVKLGFGTLTSEVNGLHSEGGGAESGPFSYQSDFAGQKFTSGLFLGYGKSFDRVYVGAEFEAEVNATEWFRKRKTSGGGRNFSAEAKEAYAASARLGYQCRNGSLAYLKAGVVTAKVITRYAKGSNRDNDIYSDRDVDGIRFGGGIETSLTPAAFVRLEYTHTEYEDYDLVTAHTNSDQLNFEHRQDMVSLGLGFRF